jgi:hypothetical protein
MRMEGPGSPQGGRFGILGSRSAAWHCQSHYVPYRSDVKPCLS